MQYDKCDKEASAISKKERDHQMKTDYDILAAQAENLVDGIPHFTANLANISALLFDSLEDINWAGFYLKEENILVLGPFQGKPACIEIPCGKGVCGTALARNEVMTVADVHCFEGHIACDSASNSEIVLPIHAGGEVVAVLDIDSTSLGRFSKEDEEGLLRIVKILEEKVFRIR